MNDEKLRFSQTGEDSLEEIAKKKSSVKKNIKSTQTEELSIKSFLKMLKIELNIKDWLTMCLLISDLDIEMSFENKTRILIQKGYIAKDFNLLRKFMRIIKREDIIAKLDQYCEVFTVISEETFNREIYKEVEMLVKEKIEWEKFLKKFIKNQHEKVIQFEEDEPVAIESVYVDVTIIEEKPRSIDEDDETTYNEIAYLRKIANKEISIVTVDFENEIISYDPYNSELWFILGNAGCGKTFLCHKIALLFVMGAMPRFSFLLSISCNNIDWQNMEKERENNDDENLLQKWLQLSMPFGYSWAENLAQHLVESDGHGLLIIIDGLDEFIKDIPFQKTLFYLILKRDVLARSTIIVTSRPGAYNSISSSITLSVDRFFNVLGFSPGNRDLYFKIQLPEEEKLKQLKEILYLHDEINQLSLLPVNASLFAALVRGSDNMTAQTLVQIYSQLVAYLIRRQLNRMNLKHMITKNSLVDLHPDVKECLFRIGEQAYLGIYQRERFNDKDVLIRVDKEEISCQCLGLAEEHFKNKGGKLKHVWSFVHLTIQEFVGSFWLSFYSKDDQCLSTRYIVNTPEIFAIFQMTLRFLCGLLSDNALNVLGIIYRYILPSPVPMNDMPKKYQFRYADSIIHEYMNWIEFTKVFIEINEILFEAISNNSISISYEILRKFLPPKIYFYFDQTPTPNGWECFLRSLPILYSIQIIQFDAKCINLSQFRSLMNCLSACHLRFLALKFSKERISTIEQYSEIIRQINLPHIKISIELYYCDLTKTEDPYFSIFQPYQYICLFQEEVQCQFIKALSNKIETENAQFYIFSSTSNFIKMQQYSNKPLKMAGLCLNKVDNECIKDLKCQMFQRTDIEEIIFYGDSRVHCASLLPAIARQTNLKFLGLSSNAQCTDEVNSKDLQLIIKNKKLLKGLELCYIHNFGINNWSEILLPLSTCTNLVEIQLSDTELDKSYCWSRAISALKCLVYFSMKCIRLTEVFNQLCIGFIRHPTIRCIALKNCEFYSHYFVYLTQLIPTIKQLNTIDISGSTFPEEDSELKILEITAKEYSTRLITNN